MIYINKLERQSNYQSILLTLLFIHIESGKISFKIEHEKVKMWDNQIRQIQHADN